MLETLWHFVERLLGLHLSPDDLELRHMAWRAFVVFVYAVILARVAARRFLGHNAGFDIVILVILGSVLSRAINGEAAFFPTLGASLLLILLHHVLATLTFRWHWFSKLVKGRPHVLVRDGRLDHQELEHCKITADDLDENLRLNGNVDGAGDVAEARLERNGVVSVIKAQDSEARRGTVGQPAD